MTLPIDRMYTEVGKIAHGTEQILTHLAEFVIHHTGIDSETTNFFLNDALEYYGPAYKFQQFFRRFAEWRLPARDFDAMRSNLVEVSKVFEHRNKVVHGTVIDLKDFGPDGSKLKSLSGAGADQESLDLIKKQFALLVSNCQPDEFCPFLLVPGELKPWFIPGNVEIHPKFYAYTLAELVQISEVVNWLQRFLSLSWKSDGSALRFTGEVFYRQVQSDEFLEKIREQMRNQYGQKQNTE